MSSVLIFIGLVNSPVKANINPADGILAPNEITTNSINLTSGQDSATDVPIHIFLPSIDTSIKVKEGQISSGTWETDEEMALYAEGSSSLTDSYGNTIIYAHAREYLFRDLKMLKIGDLVHITGDQGEYFYEVTEKESILPDEVDVVKKIGSHNLTLFTCDGLDDKYRLLIRARKLQFDLVRDDSNKFVRWNPNRI